MLLLLVFLLLKSVEGTILGLVTSESVIVAATSVLAGANLKLKSNHDGITVLGVTSSSIDADIEGEHVLVALCGDHSDCASTLAELEFVCNQHIKSYNFVLSCESIAQFYRKIVTDSLNKSHQLKVDALIGGYSPSKQRPILYRIDAAGALQDVKYAAHGPETQLILGYFDNYYGTEIDEEDYRNEVETVGSLCKKTLLDHDDGLEILRTCWKVAYDRAGKNSETMVFKAIDCQGKSVEVNGK